MKMIAKSFAVFLLTVSLFAGYSAAGQLSDIKISLTKPAQSLQMGDLPVFVGNVTNSGTASLRGIIVYLSLARLDSGKEHPEDLEDWSAQKAIRIDELKAGEVKTQNWKLRLIKSGNYGLMLTAINPTAKHAVTSNIVRFHIKAKPTIQSKQILPVAIGVPAVIVLIWLTVLLISTVRKKEMFE